MRSALREEVIDRTTEAFGFDVEFRGYRQIDAPVADIDRALALVDDSLASASPQLIKAELARLRVTTKARAEGADDLRMTMAAYAEYLTEYPADVVVDALRWWARVEKWWPAWAELKELLDRRVLKRKALRKALLAETQRGGARSGQRRT